MASQRPEWSKDPPLRSFDEDVYDLDPFRMYIWRCDVDPLPKVDSKGGIKFSDD